MTSDKTFAWLVFLTVIAIVYVPVITRLYKRWKQYQANKHQPSALLGVAYPHTNDDKDK